MADEKLDAETEAAVKAAHLKMCRGYLSWDECPHARGLRDLACKVQAIERGRAASIAEAHKHIGPFDSKDNLDRLAAYSNSTVDLIVRGIKASP